VAGLKLGPDMDDKFLSGPRRFCGHSIYFTSRIYIYQFVIHRYQRILKQFE
jgi:hypothetical protein